MDLSLIFSGNATLEDMCRLNDLGYAFVIEDGKVTQVIC